MLREKAASNKTTVAEEKMQTSVAAKLLQQKCTRVLMSDRDDQQLMVQGVY